MQKINEENTEKSGLKGTEATDSSGEPPQASSTPVDVPADRKGLGEDRSEEDSEKEKEEEEDGETASKEPEGKSDEDKPEEGHSMDKVDEEEATTSPSVQDLLKDAVPAR